MFSSATAPTRILSMHNAGTMGTQPPNLFAVAHNDVPPDAGMCR